MARAYELLKECEYIDGSGRALYYLSALIKVEDMGSYSKIYVRIGNA
jgi:hypothetical protein